MNDNADSPFDLTDPNIRHSLEMLLYLAAQRGDDDLVRERLGWGIDPNCRAKRSRTPLIANAKGNCPNIKVVKALLEFGADPSLTDDAGLTALDYARRKLMKIDLRPRRPPRKSRSLDENDQVVLNPMDQEFLARMQRELPPDDARELFRTYYAERRKAAMRRFNDPEQVESIIACLEQR